MLYGSLKTDFEYQNKKLCEEFFTKFFYANGMEIFDKKILKLKKNIYIENRLKV